MNAETPQTRIDDINAYKKVDAAFVDYTKFEGDEAVRQQQKEDFLDRVEYQPRYNYPQLDVLPDDEKLRDKKSGLYKAVLELEAARQEPGADPNELKLYADYIELRLKKIMLVEEARRLANAQTSTELEVSEAAFTALNKEVYGEFDTPTFQGMMKTEYNHAADFIPSDVRAAKIKDELLAYLGNAAEYSAEEEQLPLDEEGLGKLHETILERYGSILDAIPDTDDNVYYSAQECADIMNAALLAGGLAQLGWKAVVDSAKSNPSTNGAMRIISLPTSTRRNADELRRLVIHEQEVHARRAENGRNTSIAPLSKGTADYADVEEGLGVLLECGVAGEWNNPSFDRARDRYITAGLALGIDSKVAPRDARQVHDVLWRMYAVRNAKDGSITDDAIVAAKQAAYVHVENAFRGTEFWMRGIIYSKLKVYYEGVVKNALFMAEHIDNLNAALDIAMIGKYNHTDTSEREAVQSILKDAA